MQADSGSPGVGSSGGAALGHIEHSRNSTTHTVENLVVRLIIRDHEQGKNNENISEDLS